MPLVTTTDLTNAKADCDTLTAVATGGLGTTTDRLGGVHKTLAQLEADVEAAGPYAHAAVYALGGGAALNLQASSIGSAAHIETGHYRFTDSRLTDNAVCQVTALRGALQQAAAWYAPSTGVLDVYTAVLGSMLDSPFSLTVIAF